jgi:hypothetical protein
MVHDTPSTVSDQRDSFFTDAVIAYGNTSSNSTVSLTLIFDPVMLGIELLEYVTAYHINLMTSTTKMSLSL